jgi:hypothetical protein
MRSEIRNPRSKVGHKVPVALAVLLSSALAGRIAAAIGAPVPVEDLAKRADTVVHGKVAALECTRDPAGRIFTRVELDVAEVWKGKPAGRFALVLAGGVLGARKVAVVGGPEYRLGEEVVVFTARNASGEPVTLDLAQGKFRVEAAEASGAKHVANGVLGGPAEKSGYRLPTQVPLELSELRRRVEAAR